MVGDHEQAAADRAPHESCTVTPRLRTFPDAHKGPIKKVRVSPHPARRSDASIRQYVMSKQEAPGSDR